MSLKTTLNRLLSSATAYGEYGAGETTLFVANLPHLKEIHSVESDQGWIRDLEAQMPPGRVTFHYKNMGTLYKSWGHPGPLATEAQKRAYSDPILSAAVPIDVLLVDGRFRVACALKAHGWLAPNAILVFDDFWIRPQYHVVLDFFDVIERIDTIAVLKPKKHAVVPAPLIQQYELVAD